MRQKKYLLIIIAGILLLAAGMVFLFDQLGIAFKGATKAWYLVAILYFAAMAIAVAVIYKANLYYILAMTLGGIFVSVSLPLGIDGVAYRNTWAIIPCFLFVGIMLANAVSKGRFGYLKSSILGLLISVICLIGSVIERRVVTFAVLMMVLGVIAISVSLYRINHKKMKNKEEVFYVTPTETTAENQAENKVEKDTEKVVKLAKTPKKTENDQPNEKH